MAQQPTDLDWIQLRKELDDNVLYKDREPLWDRLKRKCTEAPLVPVGALATVAAGSYGIYMFSQGNRVKSQLMMRARVAAQGFTIFFAFLATLKASKKMQSSEEAVEPLK